MNKQRKEERKKVMTFTPVYDLQKNILLGYLSDLTLLGALLVSEKPVETNRNIILGIEFRESSETPVTRMVIPARVAWCKQEEHLTYYDTGFEFQEIGADNKNIIEAALEKYQFSRKMPF
jgi:hypothetical protein